MVYDTSLMTYAEGANRRRLLDNSTDRGRKYLDAVALADLNGTCIDEIEKLCQRIEKGNRTFSGFNPLSEETELLFQAVFNGGNHINGFTNASIRKSIFSDASEDDKKTRNKMTRILGVRSKSHTRIFPSIFPRILLQKKR